VSGRRRRGVGLLAGAALSLAILIGVAPARADVVDEAWKRGNDAYLRGDYPGAIAAFEQLDRQGVKSAELDFNLGNAYFRRGELGRAMWAWQRALELDSDHDDARFNLEQARKLANRRVQDKLEGADRDPWWVRLVNQWAPSTETWLFVITYLGFFTALALRLRARRRAAGDEGPTWGALAAILGVAAALSATLLVGRATLARLPYAVVLPDEVAVKEGADPNYRTSFTVHAGLRVRLLEHDQDWVRVRLSNGLEGWVREPDVGRL